MKTKKIIAFISILINFNISAQTEIINLATDSKSEISMGADGIIFYEPYDLSNNNIIAHLFRSGNKFYYSNLDKNLSLNSVITLDLNEFENFHHFVGHGFNPSTKIHQLMFLNKKMNLLSTILIDLNKNSYASGQIEIDLDENAFNKCFAFSDYMVVVSVDYRNFKINIDKISGYEIIKSHSFSFPGTKNFNSILFPKVSFISPEYFVEPFDFKAYPGKLYFMEDKMIIVNDYVASTDIITLNFSTEKSDKISINYSDEEIQLFNSYLNENILYRVNMNSKNMTLTATDIKQNKKLYSVTSSLKEDSFNGMSAPVSYQNNGSKTKKEILSPSKFYSFAEKLSDLKLIVTKGENNNCYVVIGSGEHSPGYLKLEYTGATGVMSESSGLTSIWDRYNFAIISFMVSPDGKVSENVPENAISSKSYKTLENDAVSLKRKLINYNNSFYLVSLDEMFKVIKISK